MKIQLRYSVLLFFFLVLKTSFSYALVDFEGTYACAGVDPYENKDYKGIIKIIRQPPVYQLEMDYDDGDHLVGTAGLFDNDALAVVFQNTKKKELIGLERYSFSDKKHKKIQGYWVYLGQEKLGKEVCEKIE